MIAWRVEWTWEWDMIDTQFSRQSDAQAFARIIEGMEADGEPMNVYRIKKIDIEKTYTSLEDATDAYGFQNEGPAT